MTYTSVPETAQDSERSVDVQGAVLAFVTISTLSFALIRGPAGWLRVEVLIALLAAAVGLATLGAPLTSATLGAVSEDDQGIASGVNNTVGQLAGLLMIVVLPNVAGLSGQDFDGPQFADGYRLAMRVCAALCLVAAAVAALTIRPATDREGPTTAQLPEA